MSRRRVLQLGGGAGLALALGACGSDETPAAGGTPVAGAGGAPATTSTATSGESAGASGEPKRGGNLMVANSASIASLDAHAGISDGEHPALFAVFEPLIRYDRTLTPQPGLAESWSFEDETTLQLNLRQGVTFHDGLAFDAEIVKWNIERVQNPETRSTARAAMSEIESVEVVDQHTVLLHMGRPNAAVLANLGDRGGMMMSPNAVETYGEDIARNPVGCGPFKFVEWQADSHISFERNPDYFDPDRPYLDSFRLIIIPTPEVQIANLETGDVDAVNGIQPKDIARLEANSSLRVDAAPSVGFLHCYINKAMAPMDDVRVRRALALCLDREAMKQALYFGRDNVGHGPLTPASWAHDPDFVGLQHNLDEARALMEEAGYGDGVEIRNVGSPNNATAAFFQAAAAEIGINIQLDTMELASWVEEMWTQENAHICVAAHQGRADPDGILWETYGPTGAYNAGKVSDPALDEIMTAARQSMDQAERAQLYHDAQRIIVNDAHGIFWRDQIIYTAARQEVEGLSAYGDSKVRFMDVWLNT